MLLMVEQSLVKHSQIMNNQKQAGVAVLTVEKGTAA